MPARRKATAAVAVGLAPLALTALAASPASAHGSMGDPVSRVSQCYAEGPESPKSAAYKAAVAAGGTQALYDWNGIRIGDAAGQHQKRIPDGKLCSGGIDRFKGLDLARADWPMTKLTAGSSFTFTYRQTIPHQGTFRVYVTKDGYEPTVPLRWSDLESKPFLTATDPTRDGASYRMKGTLPRGKSGRHVIYTIWQNSSTPDTYYACSDVNFVGATRSAAPSTAAPSTIDASRPCSISRSKISPDMLVKNSTTSPPSSRTHLV